MSSSGRPTDRDEDHGEFVLDTPTWCRPQEKVVGPGITVKTTYGYHVIVAFFYTGWKRLMRRG